MATIEVQVLNLSVQDLNRMKLEFYDWYEKLFIDAYASLRRTWKAKLKAMKECRKQQKEFDKQARISHFRDRNKHVSFTK